jgi:peptidoglycan/xylan/chitin deacetylase (PgdA/CDA1 family)
MQLLSVVPRSSVRPIALAAAILVLIGAAGCAAPNPSTSGPSPAQPTQIAPVPTMAGRTATYGPSPGKATPEASNTLPPPAGSLPSVNSCDPASVPGATATSATTSVKPDSFTLHVPVLMYHRIVPLNEAGNSIAGLVVPPQTFDAQLTALARAGWQTVTMATLADDLAAHIKPPAKTFVITIDDGWYDGFTYAWPILKSHGFVATYYVIAGRIDAPSFLSSIQLRQLVAAGNDIGDHTMNHVNLTAQGNAALTYQIDAAASRIAQVTGAWPRSLAYPSGHEDSQVVAAVGACGVLRMAVLEKALFVTTPAAAPKPGASPVPPVTQKLQAYETWTYRFLVPRIRVSPGTTPATLLAWLG